MLDAEGPGVDPSVKRGVKCRKLTLTLTQHHHITVITLRVICVVSLDIYASSDR